MLSLTHNLCKTSMLFKPEESQDSKMGTIYRTKTETQYQSHVSEKIICPRGIVLDVLQLFNLYYLGGSDN